MLPKRNMEEIATGTHGGINYTELERLGINPSDILDFSVSINPFGPPTGIREIINNFSIDRYPDSESIELRLSLSKNLGTSINNIIIGNGSTELIRLITTAYLGNEDSILIPQPTYGEYIIASNLAGAKVIKRPIWKEPDFQFNITEILSLIEKHQPKGIFLCNPNNPTGQYLSEEEIKQILSAAKNSLIILDEAYIAFTQNAWESSGLIKNDNLIILRSMTKDYALAGLRLGYAIAEESIISILQRVKPPWNVSSIAQKAGLFVLKNRSHLKESFIKIIEAKNFLITELNHIGLVTVPSQTNFFLLKVKEAAKFRQSLLTKGVMVRDCTSFGLPDYIRIAPRTLPECQRLIEVIKEIGAYHHDS
ncbi:histidinol-phosphate transaminase [Chloroflexota bacterium]